MTLISFERTKTAIRSELVKYGSDYALFGKKNGDYACIRPESNILAAFMAAASSTGTGDATAARRVDE